ncbi:YitT family protein [Lachnospiraceae bacterium 46-15]
MNFFPKMNFRVLCMEILGSFLIAVGIYNFALPAGFPMTGFSGIAIILHRLFAFPVGAMTIVLNIPVALFCYRLLGKTFFLRSFRCMLISSIMMDGAAPLLPLYHGSRLLAAISTGVLGGIGYALVYMQGSSTGGMDFITMSIKSFKPHVPLGRIVFAADAVIILIGGIIFGDVDGIIYGLIVTYLFSIMVDRTMYGANAGKLTLIVTSRPRQITETIVKCIGRGSTILNGQGSYRHEERFVILCACSKKQMYSLQQAVRLADPGCFLIILESNEVHGEGFHPLVLGQKPGSGH